jgi:hypothetical protein
VASAIATAARSTRSRVSGARFSGVTLAVLGIPLRTLGPFVLCTIQYRTKYVEQLHTATFERK